MREQTILPLVENHTSEIVFEPGLGTRIGEYQETRWGKNVSGRESSKKAQM